MLELLLLLLPLAAASGWIAAKRAVRKERDKLRSVEMDPAYFRGLNYLVNEQPDKAIDVFVRMLEVNRETVEMHLALGSLFRRRGEADRAIRIHQNLIARSTLSAEQRCQALLELGQDYLHAGLLDRAEALFSELVEKQMLLHPALENLKIIYQHEKEWLKALQASHHLRELGDKKQDKDQTHFLCELADAALLAGDSERTLEYLNAALELSADALRPQWAKADFLLQRGRYQEALLLYRKIAEEYPAFIGEFLSDMAQCHAHLTTTMDWMDWLRDFYQRRHNLSVLLAIAQELEVTHDIAAAIDFLNEALETESHLLGLQHLIRLRLKQQGNERTKFLETLGTLVDQMVSKQSAFHCHRCGFTSRSLHWQCPGCRSWGSMLPQQGSHGRQVE
jgi:lipopolysaccharide biosynthesis regulator YciM